MLISKCSKSHKSHQNRSNSSKEANPYRFMAEKSLFSPKNPQKFFSKFDIHVNKERFHEQLPLKRKNREDSPLSWPWPRPSTGCGARWLASACNRTWGRASTLTFFLFPFSLYPNFCVFWQKIRCFWADKEKKRKMLQKTKISRI